MSYILFHNNGTAGDYVTFLLESTGQFFSSRQYEINDQGKCDAVGDKPEVAAVIKDTKWGSRDWSDFDESLLLSLTDKKFILNTSEYTQIKQLRKAGCNWPIIRIRYSTNLSYFIKKSILKKVYRKVFTEEEPKHPQQQKLIEKGIWSLLFFRKHLSEPEKFPVLRDHYKDETWTQYPCDTEIDLENVLLNNFTQLKSIADIEKFDSAVINAWSSKQDQKFILRPKMPAQIENLIGFNPHIQPSKNICELDDYDKMLIRFHYPDAPKFNNTEELFTYF